jgi:hypothetical protein
MHLQQPGNSRKSLVDHLLGVLWHDANDCLPIGETISREEIYNYAAQIQIALEVH